MNRYRPTVWTMETVRARCDEVGDCLIWRGAVNSAGYPSASFNGKSLLVRRIVFFEIQGRKLTHGRKITSRCLNPLCCSDKCLVQGFQAAIIRNAAARHLRADPMILRRQQRGAVQSGQGKRKLSANIAEQIRTSAEDNKALAARWQVTPETIRHIRRGKSWRTPALAATSIFNLGSTL